MINAHNLLDLPNIQPAMFWNSCLQTGDESSAAFQGMSIRAKQNLQTIQYDTQLQVFSKRYRGSDNFYGTKGKPTLQTIELSDKSQPESN